MKFRFPGGVESHCIFSTSKSLTFDTFGELAREWVKRFFFSRCPFFGPLKLRGSRFAELFQGKKPQIFVEKNIAKRQKYLFMCEAATQPSQWPANCPSQAKNTSHLFLQSCEKKKHHLLKLGGWAACKFYPGKNTIRFDGRGGEKCRLTFNHLPLH